MKIIPKSSYQHGFGQYSAPRPGDVPVHKIDTGNYRSKHDVREALRLAKLKFGSKSDGVVLRD